MDDSPLDVHSPLAGIVLILLIIPSILLAIPILAVSFAISLVISTVLLSIGVPNAIAGLAILIVGFGGGLAVEFLVLVRLYRRFAPRLQKLTPRHETRPPRARRDPAADPATVAARLSELDARMAPPEDVDRPADPTDPTSSGLWPSR